MDAFHSNYPLVTHTKRLSLIIAGNLHRLAGEHEEARALFDRGGGLLLTKIGCELEDRGEDLDKDVLLLDLTYLNLCCFFLGRYEEVEDLEAFERRVDPGTTISWTGRIARARRLDVCCVDWT